MAPVTAVVSAVHHVPGDTVRPGDLLFTLRLLSESLHLTQTELFKTSQDIKLAQNQRKRLVDAGAGIAAARIVEVDNQITRLKVAAKAYRQELLNRGLSPDDISAVAEGKFVRTIPVVAPPPRSGPGPMPVALKSKSAPLSGSPQTYEVQELKVELGQQVQAGQTLACWPTTRCWPSRGGRSGTRRRCWSEASRKGGRSKWTSRRTPRRAGPPWADLPHPLHGQHH